MDRNISPGVSSGHPWCVNLIGEQEAFPVLLIFSPGKFQKSNYPILYNSVVVWITSIFQVVSRGVLPRRVLVQPFEKLLSG